MKALATTSLKVTGRLHQAARAGDTARVAGLLDASVDPARELAACDASGCTVLMCAAGSSAADTGMLRLLIARGADPHQETPGHAAAGRSALAMACAAGCPDKSAFLIAAGADPRQRSCGGYTLLMQGAFGRTARTNPRLAELLGLLLRHGVDVNAESDCRDTALRTLANLGRFDAVRCLLAAGADMAQLRWTPLMCAAALGSAEQVAHLLGDGHCLDAEDWWNRTAFLIAVQGGDLAKARLLAGPSAAWRPDVGAAALAAAIEGRHPHLLRWLLALGRDMALGGESGLLAVRAAVECDDAEALGLLLAAGAGVQVPEWSVPLLFDARDAAVVRLLLDAGCDAAELTPDGRRALLGLAPQRDDELEGVAQDVFEREWTPRHGNANPQPMPLAFWHAMLAAGNSARAARRQFGAMAASRRPVWCADRLGQSASLLEDGRVLLVGGVHERPGDADHHVYNDLILREADGTLRIFGYPQAVFPGTAFHSATVAGSLIYLIGNGADAAAAQCHTPVYRLHLKSLAIECVETFGDGPGWIGRHRAVLEGGGRIRIEGGEVRGAGTARSVPNPFCYALDLATLHWQRMS